MIYNKEVLNKPYNSPYPSEITYKSDKNFLVRLKAALDRNMRDLGYNINSDQHKELIERMNDAEDWFFESKIKPLPVTGESEAIGERKFTIDEILLYGARCAVNGRKMNPVAYFKEHFNVDITIGDNL